MKIAAVIVTYNRLALLKEVINAFEKQKRVPDYLIVVNNASTDGTKEYLIEWSKKKDKVQKIIISTLQNIGGSGGFYLGTKKASELDVDWIWASDDDAIPNLDVFEKLEKHINDFSKDNVSAVCTQVQMEGATDLTHRKWIATSWIRMYQKAIPPELYKEEYFELDSISYVGIVMKREALEQAGLINKDYFIWQDDLEHSIRLGKVGKMICFPDMIVEHKITKADYVGVNWKTYYGYRNDLLTLKYHYPFRYFVFKILRIMQKSICSLDRVHVYVALAAIIDAIRDKKGIHKKYKPGWTY